MRHRNSRPLRLIDHTLRRVFHAAATRPKSVMAVLTIAFVGAALGLNGLKISLNTLDMVGHRDPSSRHLEELRELFPERDKLYLLIRSPEPGPLKAGVLCAIQREFERAADSNFEVEAIYSPLDLRRAQSTDDHRLFYPKIMKPCEDSVATLAAVPNLWNGLFVTPSRNDMLAEISFMEVDPPGKFGHVDPIAIGTVMDELDAKLPLLKSWSGTAAFYRYSKEGIDRAQLLNLGILVLISVGLRTLFGTWRAGFFFTVTLIFTNVIVHGAMGARGDALNPLTVSIFLMLAVAALEDFVYLGYAQMRQGGTIFQAMRPLLLPSFFTSFTTALGFGSLMISDVETIRVFGLWTCLGAMIEWIAVFILLTTIFKLFPRASKIVAPERAFFRSLAPSLLSYSIPRRAAFSLVLVLIPLSSFLDDIRLSFSVADLFPKSHAIQLATGDFKATRGWEAEVSLVFDTKDTKDKIATLRAHPLVAKVEDMPSFLEDISTGFEGLDRELIEREALSSPFADRLVSSRGSSRAIAYLKSTDVDAVVAFQEFANDLCKAGDCFLTGDLIAYADFTRRVLRTLYESLFVSLALVACVLVFLAGWSRRHLIFPLIASAFWGPFVVLIAIATLEIQIDMVTVIVISTLVGLTGDNAILFLLSSKTGRIEDGIEERGQGAIQCSFLMAFSCLILLLSYFQPPRLLGMLLAAGLIAALFGDVWILTGLLKKKRV